MNAYPSPPSTPSTDRVRMAWQRRAETDYVFDFWTTFGWTVLTCGIYGIYAFYQLVRRMRDHNLRRLELLDAANAFAWERANSTGLADELRPYFERTGANLATLRAMTSDFRDPAIWTVIYLIGGAIAMFVAYALLDGDLVRHDQAEGAIEADLAAIFTRLGAPLPQPDPARLKGTHNYAGRIIASLASLGVYLLWWWHDMMVEPNRHFAHNWPWEDALAVAVQQLAAAAQNPPR